jgi:hypothetical protein
MKVEDVLEVLPMLMLKVSWINSLSFGDMNNVPKRFMKFHPGPIIIERI